MRSGSRLAVGMAALALAAGCAPAAPPAPATTTAEAPAPVATPLERVGYERLTRHDELVAFVGELAMRSDRVTRRSLGRSVEGREIPHLEISEGTFGKDPDKVRVLIFAQQHGNEPSGKEAALALLRDIAEGRHDRVLRHVDLLLVPSVNPDGGERHERRNAADVDLNRSHLVLNGHEVRLLRELFHQWEPEVTLDVHEYGPWSPTWTQHGYIRLFDEMYGLPTNINVPEGIRSLAGNGFLPHIDDYLHERGFTHHEYLVGSPDYLRYSTSDINDGRQGFAILGTLGMILEGKRGRGPADNIERRTAGQLAALEGLLEFAAEQREEIRRTVHAAREELRQGAQRDFVLVMDRARADEPLRIPTLGVERGADGDFVAADTVNAEIEAYHPRVVETVTTSLPDYYLIPGEQRDLIALLREHRVEMVSAEPGRLYPVEVLHIESFEDVRIKDGERRLPVLSTHRGERRTVPGDVLVSTAQLRGLMVATVLEPGSMHALLGYDEFSHLGVIGAYPVLRVLGR